MKWRWRLGKLFGIELYMHVTFLLLLAWFAFIPLAQGRGWAAAMASVLFILLLFACVVMHEYGHALTARRYGIRTRDITLLPIGGVSSLERMPRDPMQELAVALAGPAVNVVIAAILALFLWLFGQPVSFTGMQPGSMLLIQNMYVANVWLVLFNLLPAFPMDGGRVLRALLARRVPYEQATRTAAGVGQTMAFLFGFWGLLGGNVWLLFIALFVYMGAEAEAQSVQVQSAFRGLPVGRLMISRFSSLRPEDTLGQAVQLLLSGSQQDFPVMRDGQVVGLLTRRDLLAALHERGPGGTVAEAMRRDVTPVESDAPLDETFQRMQSEGLPVLPVTRNGDLVGLLSLENIAEYLMVSAALDGAPTTPGQVVEQTAQGAEKPGGTGSTLGAWPRRRRGETPGG